MNDRVNFGRGAIIGLLLLLLAITGATAPRPPTATSLRAAPAAASPADTARFAVIGDYGSGSHNERDVANLIEGWNVEFVATTGDNNYPSGEAATIDDHIGQFYSGYIYPYQGSYGGGTPPNRFFPALGNHDWASAGAEPYLNYFTLPGNERYYDYTWGPVQFFAVDSDRHEPDGNTSSSLQATWLRDRLAASTAPWKIVYLHHPPFSSGEHGSTTALQWPYQQWGASAVLSGHDHDYERIVRDGFPYIVNGLGGASIYGFGNPVSGSEVRYNGDYGALLVTASTTNLTFQFISRANYIADSYTLTTGAPTATPTPPPTDTFTVTPPPTDTFTVTPAPTDTFTVTPAPTDTFTVTPTPTDTFTVTPVPTDTIIATPAPIDTFTVTPTPTDTSTVTPVPTDIITVTPEPTDTPTITPTPDTPFPLRAAFYYPWYPEHWGHGTHYSPTLGFYNSSDPLVIQSHIDAMLYGRISAGIAAWRGQGTPTDERISALLQGAAGTPFQWSLYYEKEGSSDPAVSELAADLQYLHDRYGGDPHYLHINGRFVVFVYADSSDGCAMVDRWQTANTVGAYLVLKVFSGYRTCAQQPDNWHQYGPAQAADQQRGYSYTISPGFWRMDEPVRLPRDLTRWRQNIRDMVASGEPLQLITSFNEWSEGSAVESAGEWASASGYGAYLDALHDNGNPPGTPSAGLPMPPASGP